MTGEIYHQTTLKNTHFVVLPGMYKAAIFVSVFHRILDFKNGAGSLSWPLIFYMNLHHTNFRTRSVCLVALIS